MINYNYTYRADIVQRNPTTRGPTDVLGHHGQKDQQATGHPGPRLPYLTDAPARWAAPVTSPITLGWQPSIEEARGRPSPDRLDVPTEEGPSIMSPLNDRRTSKATVSPDKSIRRVRRAHHRAQPAEIICNKEEQQHSLTDGVKGTSGNSRPGDTASCWQYWGRRRYGPV